MQLGKTFLQRTAGLGVRATLHACRATSRLSAMNRERVRRLIAVGRMTKVGLASMVQ
jgi:hypothetical protein